MLFHAKFGDSRGRKKKWWIKGSFQWRRVPELDWTGRICNPLHNRFANAPRKNKVRTQKISNGGAFQS